MTTYGILNLNTREVNISPSIAVAGSFEIPVSTLVPMLLRKGNIAIDVGANIGYYTTMMAKIVGPVGHVFAFEPESKNMAFLHKNIVDNNLGNVTLEEMIVSDADGNRSLFLSKDPSLTGQHSIVRRLSNETLLRESCKLDTSLDQAGVRRVDLVKIDVEGAEGLVLKGLAGRLGSGDVRTIIIERNTESIDVTRDVLPELARAYRLFPIFANHLGREVSAKAELPGRAGNLLLVRKTRR